MATNPASLYVFEFFIIIAVEVMLWTLYQLHRETHKRSRAHEQHAKTIRLNGGGRLAVADGRAKAGARTRPDWF